MKGEKRRLATTDFEMDTADPPGLPSALRGGREDQDTRNTCTNHDAAVVEKEFEKQDGSGKQIVSEKLGRSEMDQVKVGEDLTKQSRSEINSDQMKKGGPSNGSSWVEVAQEKKILKQYVIDITEQEGQKTVEIPDDIRENVNHIWEDFLIGKFLDTAPYIARVHAIVNRIWSQGGSFQKIEVFEVDATTMKFRVTNPMIRARIFKRGMWNIGNIPLAVTKWTPEELKVKPEIKSIPL